MHETYQKKYRILPIFCRKNPLDPILKTPRRWLALTATWWRWLWNSSLRAKVTPRSLTSVSSLITVPSKLKEEGGRGVDRLLIDIPWHFVGSNWTFHLDLQAWGSSREACSELKVAGDTSFARIRQYSVVSSAYDASWQSGETQSEMSLTYKERWS